MAWLSPPILPCFLSHFQLLSPIPATPVQLIWVPQGVFHVGGYPRACGMSPGRRVFLFILEGIVQLGNNDVYKHQRIAGVPKHLSHRHFSNMAKVQGCAC